MSMFRQSVVVAPGFGFVGAVLTPCAVIVHDAPPFALFMIATVFAPVWFAAIAQIVAVAALSAPGIADRFMRPGVPVVRAGSVPVTPAGVHGAPLLVRVQMSPRLPWPAARP